MTHRAREQSPLRGTVRAVMAQFDAADNLLNAPPPAGTIIIVGSLTLAGFAYLASVFASPRLREKKCVSILLCT